MSTYEGVFATGWKATVKAENAAAARRRLRQTGRGERFTVRTVVASAHAVWGRDSDDDDYEDHE